MDNISTEPVQNVDYEARKVMADCLCIPLVLRKILHLFCSTDELLELSLVNKLWNYEARSVMRKRGNVIARLDRFVSCPNLEDLESIGSDLQQMNVVPFSGIRMKMGPSEDTCKGRSDVHYCIQDIIWYTLPLKYFSVQVAKGWWEHEQCPAILLVKMILERCAGRIHEFAFHMHDEMERKIFVEKVIKDSSFSSLKILKLSNDSKCLETTDVECWKAMISLAPNLQELHSKVPANYFSDILQFLKERRAMFVCTSTVSGSFNSIVNRFAEVLRLQDVDLTYDTHWSYGIDGFDKMIPLVLQTCCMTTLRKVTIHALCAVPLMSCGICLRNVNKLEMKVNTKPSGQKILGLVRHFDFTPIFPSLKEVTIAGINDYYTRGMWSASWDAFSEQAYAVLKEPLPDRAVNIKALNVRGCYLSDSFAKFLAEMFPSVEKLRVEDNFDGSEFGFICKHFGGLKELDVTVERRWHIFVNFESVMGGIFPEEVAELSEKDEAYLEKVNIVPTMPAITCLRNLRTCRLCFLWSNYFSVQSSKVMQLIVFQRCPALAVTVTTREAKFSEKIKFFQRPDDYMY